MCLDLMSWVQQVHNAAMVARSLGCQCDTDSEIPGPSQHASELEGLGLSLTRINGLSRNPVGLLSGLLTPDPLREVIIG